MNGYEEGKLKTRSPRVRAMAQGDAYLAGYDSAQAGVPMAAGWKEFKSEVTRAAEDASDAVDGSDGNSSPPIDESALVDPGEDTASMIRAVSADIESEEEDAMFPDVFPDEDDDSGEGSGDDDDDDDRGDDDDD